MKSDLILLHAALGCKKQLFFLKEKLEKQYNLHFLDFDGHGEKSNLVNKFSIDLFTDNLIEFIKSNNLKKVEIFGYSMGGYIALNLALKQPVLVSKITTYGTKLDWDLEFAEKEIKNLNPTKIKEKVPVFADYLESFHGPDWVYVVEKTEKMMLELGKGSALTNKEFSKILTPTNILIGDKDFMVSVKESEDVSHKLANGKLSIINDSNHTPDKWNVDAILNHL